MGTKPPTQPEEEGEEEEPSDDDEVAEDPVDPANAAPPRGGQNSEEGETSTVHTAQGTTTAWVSVVNFHGNLSTLHEHEATINAMARDWLEQAQQPIRDAMGGWGEVNTSRPPYYGLHAPSRVNKQPKDGDKPADHLLDNNSFDLLGLHDDDNTGGQGREQSRTSSEGRTLSTGRSYQPRGDGLVYRQPDNPTRWSRRGSEQPVIPEQNNPGPSCEGDQKRKNHQTGHLLLQCGDPQVPQKGGAWFSEDGEETADLGRLVVVEGRLES